MADTVIREPNTEYILSLSYGKDSLACLEAIKRLGYPLDRIVHAEVWATDDIPADLPPMVEFKAYADKIIKERYGYDVEHICAVRKGGGILSYEMQLYSWRYNKKRNSYTLYGFPITRGQWCTSKLKTDVLSAVGEGNLRKIVLSCTDKKNGGGNRIYGFPGRNHLHCNSALKRDVVAWTSKGLSSHKKQLVQKTQNSVSTTFSVKPDSTTGVKTSIVQYLGIAADEPERIQRHSVPGKVLPLVAIGWDEAYCRKWCEDNNLLSPIYTTATRGGCWFCHNQGVEQLRLLRHNYPDLWALLLKWDLDSPTTFKADGHTVHDYDKRYALEDAGLIQPGDKKFRWKQVFLKE